MVDARQNAVARAIAGTLGRAAEALAGILPARLLTAFDRRLSDAAVEDRLTHLFRKASDPLPAGRARDFAESHWPPAQWPTLYMDIPADIRRPLLWDGRLPGGAAASWLSWRHFSAPVCGAIVRAGCRAGIAWALAVALLLLAVTAGRTALEAPVAHPYPSWAVDAGISAPIFWWYLERAATVLFTVGEGLMLTVVAALSAGLAASVFSSAKILGDWWEEAGRPLRAETHDSLVMYDARADARPAEYLAYVRQAQAAIGRVAAQPVLPIGRATGVFRARGDMESPAADQLVAIDGESIRQHVLAFGATGSGKTRLLMEPLFAKVMTAAWGADQTLGAMVVDARGMLWHDVLPVVAERRDVRIVGTEDGHFGVDLLAGLSPAEVAATLTAVGAAAVERLAPDLREILSRLVAHAATLAAALDRDAETADAYRALGCRPWSLAAVALLAGSPEHRAAAIRRGQALPADAEAIPAADLAAAIGWLDADWASLPPEARAEVTATLDAITGDLVTPGPLRDRFAAGLWENTIDVSHALGGGVVLVALGDAAWGSGGRMTAAWLKCRLYTLARKKLEATRGQFRDTSTALFIDDFQELATAGPDGDDRFWNTARETGMFLVAATRSLTALRRVLGATGADDLLTAVHSKVVLQTEEPELLDYVLKVSGDLPAGDALGDSLPQSPALREAMLPDQAPPLPDGQGATRWGCIPRRAPLKDLLPAPPVAHAGRGSRPGAAALSWRPKISVDDLLLGRGLAFAIVQRAGADRADIVDLAAT